MLKKFLFFFKIIFIIEKKLEKPIQKKILIFDCESKDLINLLNSSDVGVVSNRISRIKQIYINKFIIGYMFKNFYRENMKLNYLIALIKSYNPKVVITSIDNSQEFYSVSKNLNNKIKFIALQNATRETKYLPQRFTKKIFLPEYHCLSEYDKKIFERKKLKVKKYFLSGSLRAALALKNIRKKKLS